MAGIVGVHGIGQQYVAGPRLSADWLLAIRGGIEVGNHRDLADRLHEGHVRVAHFGDLFRPPGSMSGQAPAHTVDDLDSPADRALLETLAKAVEADPALRPPDGAMGAPRRNLNVLLETVLRWKPFSGVVRSTFIGNLRQVNRFLDEPGTKDKALERLDKEVRRDTKVLIGHSLGSVVAYEYLCEARPRSVELFITIGSPLGMPNVIFDRLTPHPLNGLGAWPGPSTAWLNVADESDIVALRGRLQGLFHQSPAGAEIQDRLVDNGSDAHSAERYLTSAEVGSALAEVL